MIIAAADVISSLRDYWMPLIGFRGFAEAYVASSISRLMLTLLFTIFLPGRFS